MAELKKSGLPNDFHVHVSFQLVGDATYNSQKKAIEATLAECFGETYTLEHEDPEGPTDREVIYRVQKPIMVEGTALGGFFANLEKLFTATQRYLPAFTQSSEASA